MADGEKKCPRCHEVKPFAQFGWHHRPERNPSKLYVNSPCKACSKTAEHPAAVRDRRLRLRYGLSSVEFERRLQQQGGCAACGRTESNGKYWHVDHDHACCPTDARSCGKCIRGILCHGCNTALGNVNDSVETLRKMIKYLEMANV
jgi:hypothetical protein